MVIYPIYRGKVTMRALADKTVPATAVMHHRPSHRNEIDAHGGLVFKPNGEDFEGQFILYVEIIGSKYTSPLHGETILEEMRNYGNFIGYLHGCRMTLENVETYVTLFRDGYLKEKSA